MKKMILLVLAAAASFTFTANANPLDRYTDRTLLREMEYRGYTCTKGTPWEENFIVLATCDQYSNLLLEIYDRRGNKSADSKIFMSGQRHCLNEKERILNRTVNGQLNEPRVIAICDPYSNMLKMRFERDSISQQEKVFQGSVARCSAEANAFNDIFN